MKNLILFASLAVAASAEPAYTNHAGYAVSGAPVALDARSVTISNDLESVTVPLSIFPRSEQRRIAADYVLAHPAAGAAALRVPVAVKQAVEGAEKAMARSRKRAAKGLCTQEASDAFCAESEAALRTYLAKQIASGAITPAERKALGH